MPDLVVDASLASAWCFPDEQTEYTNGILHTVTQMAGAIAPCIFGYELHNTVLMGVRRKRITQDDAMSFIFSLKKMQISLINPPSYEELFALANNFNLTVYDAAYLELALKEKLPLASLDKSLCNAVIKNGGALYKI